MHAASPKPPLPARSALRADRVPEEREVGENLKERARTIKRGENEFDPQQNSEPVSRNRTVRFPRSPLIFASVSRPPILRV